MAFNDADHPVNVLVGSLRISATALNLQRNCSEVIFIDVPVNENTAKQAAGRVLRIGQEKKCYCWIFTVDHTYDQVIQGHSMLKILSIIAGSAM